MVIIINRPFGVRTSLSAEAEEWTPSDGMKWEDKNWEGKLDKLQKDAEKRMEEKIDELMSNVAASGAAEN